MRSVVDSALIHLTHITHSPPSLKASHHVHTLPNAFSWHSLSVHPHVFILFLPGRPWIPRETGGIHGINCSRHETLGGRLSSRAPFLVHLQQRGSKLDTTMSAVCAFYVKHHHHRRQEDGGEEWEDRSLGWGWLRGYRMDDPPERRPPGGGDGAGRAPPGLFGSLRLSSSSSSSSSSTQCITTTTTTTTISSPTFHHATPHHIPSVQGRNRNPASKHNPPTWHRTTNPRFLARQIHTTSPCCHLLH